MNLRKAAHILLIGQLAALAYLGVGILAYFHGIDSRLRGLAVAPLTIAALVDAVSAWITVRAARTVLSEPEEPRSQYGLKGLAPATAIFCVCAAVSAFLIQGAIGLGAVRIDRFDVPSAAEKSNLGTIRSSLMIYYGDMEGQYPSELASLTVAGKYVVSIPLAKTPGYHPDSSAIRAGKISDDAGGWLYDNDTRDADFGTLRVNCTHTDNKGTVWTSY